jgi:hypothetical protein
MAIGNSSPALLPPLRYRAPARPDISLSEGLATCPDQALNADPSSK